MATWQGTEARQPESLHKGTETDKLVRSNWNTQTIRDNNQTMRKTWGITQPGEWNSKKQLKQIMTENKTTVADMGNKRQNMNNFDETEKHGFWQS